MNNPIVALEGQEPDSDITADPLVARILAEAARAATLAHDELFALKRELAIAQEPERARVSLEVETLRAELSDARAALSDAGWQQKLDRQKARADHFETHCGELLSSTSWRITAPLRALSRRLRRR